MISISIARSSTARLFSREEAAATLPLVRRIVADIRADNASLQALLPELRAARLKSRVIGTPAPELTQVRQQVAEITTRFEGYLDELAQIGCVYRGATVHVDFRGEHEGRPVFFCWSTGDDDVAHAHPLGSDCRRREAIALDPVLPLAGA